MQGGKLKRLKTLQKTILKGGVVQPKTSQSEGCQLELGKTPLDSFIDMKNELVCLGKVINWKRLCSKFGKGFHENQGRPGLPIRLMAGLYWFCLSFHVLFLFPPPGGLQFSD